MNFRELFVNNLLLDHIDEISNIWIESIPYNIKSVMGKKIIQNYLEKLRQLISQKRKMAYLNLWKNIIIGKLLE